MSARDHSASEQYSLAHILGIWAAATVPMAALAWVVAPALRVSSPLAPGLTYWAVMTMGMAWQFVLALLLLRRELGDLSWARLAPRIWARLPIEPRTGRPRARLLWWALPAAVVAGGIALFAAELLDAPLAALGVIAPASTSIQELNSPDNIGQWWILGLALVSCLFNYVLGEELLFRGVLLPRMGGVFGRWDWVANALLFTAYHLHKPWALFSILFGSLIISGTARRYRSNWLAVLIHGADGVFLLVLVVLVLTGASSR